MWDQHLQGKKIGLELGRTPFDPARPTLLMVHGAGGRGDGWLPQLSGLAREMNLAGLDLPGHGNSPGAGLATIAAYAAWVMDFLDAGPVRPVLMGHSMGGAIALTVGLTRPELLKGLILVGTGARLRVAPAILEGLKHDFKATVEMIVGYAYAPGADPALLKEGTRRMLQNRPEVLWGDFNACDKFDVSGELGQICLPTLIVVGETDLLTPLKFSQFLAEHIPDAGLELIPDAGHMVFLEQYKEVNRAVLEFMAQR